MDEGDWRGYLSAFHDERSGVTERVLTRCAGDPYGWLTEPLETTTGWIVDLACGSAPTRDRLPGHRWVGVDGSAGELAVAAARGRGPLVRADAEALPFAGGSADVVCAAMSLQLLTPLDGVLARVRRVLRPDGLLAALVPARLGFDPRGLPAWARVLRALGVRGQSWPNPGACDGLGGLLAERGFRVLSSRRRVFGFPVDSAEALGTLLDGLYLPDTSPERIAAARESLAAWARPGRRLPIPLRRVLARP
ncbi:class I SAM-dependent methyltransferase [Actinopolyspora mortivallis]|uniref:SAM-dependent methyltransferase n=1 Tax=Actinopolyspora mortivallis TaxID=33906 RepID=A0A2T0GT58_ACTMO|nr:class I SAM-dependent methyltransferase [Actinopolyspora mortivallis]PRW62302.1 SAM-dependent methyltransferase [Actinopolyspora mortivallis]